MNAQTSGQANQTILRRNLVEAWESLETEAQNLTLTEAWAIVHAAGTKNASLLYEALMSRVLGDRQCPEVNTRWQHQKGTIYRVDAIALPATEIPNLRVSLAKCTDTEQWIPFWFTSTGETWCSVTDGIPRVVYRRGAEHPWARRLDEFVGDRHGSPRFIQA